MKLEALSSELRPPRAPINLQSDCGHIMDGRTRAIPLAGERRRAELKRLPSDGNSWRSFPTNYFSLESLLLLVCLTVSLLILPLILPPLPPPPIMLLLLPVGILAVLLVLAFTRTDIQNIASSYL